MINKPFKSSQQVLDAIPRIRHWLRALEQPKSQFSRWQVVKDLMDLAHYVAFDDGLHLGREKLARELEEKIEK